MAAGEEQAIIDRARPYEESDVAILAAELGFSDDEVAVDVLRRAWRAGFWRAWIEFKAGLIEAAARSPR
jgi:hypothetical protein